MLYDTIFKTGMQTFQLLPKVTKTNDFKFRNHRNFLDFVAFVFRSLRNTNDLFLNHRVYYVVLSLWRIAANGTVNVHELAQRYPLLRS